MAHHELELDSAVRNWVFIPLTLAIILMKLLTQYANMLMFSNTAPSNKAPKELKEQQLVIRSQRFRTMYRVIPESAFNMRKEFFVGKNTGVFNNDPQSRPLHESMSQDPSMMADMLKRNLTGIIPQFAMGMIVNFFFSGFVIGKVPFPLSPRFKLMLQRGIDLASLDVSYFTSLSYYILLLFASRGLFSLVFRDETVDETEVMRKQMNPMAGNPVFDASQAFKTEKTALATLDHEWDVEGSEEKAVRVLKRLTSKP